MCSEHMQHNAYGPKHHPKISLLTDYNECNKIIVHIYRFRNKRIAPLNANQFQAKYESLLPNSLQCVQISQGFFFESFVLIF